MAIFEQKSYQLSFKELRHIKHRAKEQGWDDQGGHPPGDAGAQVTLPVLVWSAHTAVPLVSNDDGEEDGGIEDDVVEGEEELGEDDGIQFTVVRKWPLEHQEKLFNCVCQGAISKLSKLSQFL